MSRGGAYYNEIDPFAAAWLRELIRAGHIAPGEVDERSIEDVVPNDLAGFVQCHFFAGIGVWSYALRRAGWPDERPVWTGSCPCQPFSTAGKGKRFADERHLWPALYHLIGQRRPDHVFGEQVASTHGLAWLNLVQADLENAAYTIGMVDTCAAGFGAPQIRQRLYWVAHAEMRGHIGGNVGDETEAEPKAFGRGENEGSGGNDFAHGREDVRLADTVWTGRPARGAEPGHGQAAGIRGAVGVGNSVKPRLQGRYKKGAKERQTSFRAIDTGWMADAASQQEHKEQQRPSCAERGRGANEPRGCGLADAIHTTGPTNGQWRDVDWLFCRDGKWRPVRPGTFPLAHGAPARVGRLRGYGNAINAAQAEEFIRAYMEVKE